MSVLSLPEKIEKWGKALIVFCTIMIGTAAVASKIVETVKAGPDALVETVTLKKRVRRLEHQSRFVVSGIEELTKKKYRPLKDNEIEGEE